MKNMELGQATVDVRHIWFRKHGWLCLNVYPRSNPVRINDLAERLSREMLLQTSVVLFTLKMTVTYLLRSWSHSVPSYTKHASILSVFLALRW